MRKDSGWMRIILRIRLNDNSMRQRSLGKALMVKEMFT